MLAFRAAAATLAAAAIAFAAAPNAIGAGNGLAWDSVTKLSMTSDASTLQPGDFSQDYARAAAVPPPPDGGGGFMGKMNQAIAMGRHMQALMQEGFAEKHYIAGSKDRTDQVSDQTATIVDCSSRTVTTLNLRKKTYKVESMDAPATGDSGGDSSGAPHPRATDDLTHLSIVIANTALGAKTLGGEPTNGYKSEISFTETRSSGETLSQNGDLVGYYSSYANPAPNCFWGGNPHPDMKKQQNAAAGFSAVTGGFARVMQAMSLIGRDSRFSLKQSGPPLPRGKLALYEAATLGGGPQGGGTFSTERGNVRSIAANDPIFSVPSDFTLEK